MWDIWRDLTLAACYGWEESKGNEFIVRNSKQWSQVTYWSCPARALCCQQFSAWLAMLEIREEMLICFRCCKRGNWNKTHLESDWQNSGLELAEFQWKKASFASSAIADDLPFGAPGNELLEPFENIEKWNRWWWFWCQPTFSVTLERRICT